MNKDVFVLSLPTIIIFGTWNFECVRPSLESTKWLSFLIRLDWALYFDVKGAIILFLNLVQVKKRFDHQPLYIFTTSCLCNSQLCFKQRPAKNTKFQSNFYYFIPSKISKYFAISKMQLGNYVPKEYLIGEKMCPKGPKHRR